MRWQYVGHAGQRISEQVVIGQRPHRRPRKMVVRDARGDRKRGSVSLKGALDKTKNKSRKP